MTFFASGAIGPILGLIDEFRHTLYPPIKCQNKRIEDFTKMARNGWNGPQYLSNLKMVLTEVPRNTLVEFSRNHANYNSEAIWNIRRTVGSRV